jgi:hypothetical protein
VITQLLVNVHARRRIGEISATDAEEDNRGVGRRRE